MANDQMAELRSPRAMVCHREISGEMGGATIHCVVLADGFIVECGSSGVSDLRAKRLAEAVNSYGPEKFTDLWKG